MTRQVLIVVHQKASNPGRIGEFLVERGYTLEHCCPNLGDPLPQDLAGYAAVVVFGGPQSANDDHLPGIRAELDWLEARAVPSGCPLLGICLGAQEIARAVYPGRTTRRRPGRDRLLRGVADPSGRRLS